MKILLCMALAACVTYVTTDRNSPLTDKLRDVLLPRLTDTRIVGGNPVGISMHPHQVSIRYKNERKPKNQYSHLCGGSIYSDRVIITASHCVVESVPQNFQVVAGSKNRKGNDGYIAPVEEIIMHENFNSSMTDNDIAILVLGAPLPLNNYTVRAIQLAEHDDDTREGKMATVTGWGDLISDGKYAEELQEVNVPIISNKDCAEDYINFRKKITVSMICAGYRGVGGKDACQGDSGGPLVSDGKLIGVVSWGRDCADPKYPGVYAKISYLRPWIMEKLLEKSMVTKL